MLDWPCLILAILGELGPRESSPKCISIGSAVFCEHRIKHSHCFSWSDNPQNFPTLFGISNTWFRGSSTQHSNSISIDSTFFAFREAHECDQQTYRPTTLSPCHVWWGWEPSWDFARHWRKKQFLFFYHHVLEHRNGFAILWDRGSCNPCSTLSLLR